MLLHRCGLEEGLPDAERRRSIIDGSAARITKNWLVRQMSRTARHCSVLIAMHPDQATEYVVSCALALGKPWAIVPCCVFARSFPDRRLQTLTPRAAQPAADEPAGRGVHGGAEGSDEAAGVVEEEGRPVVLFDDFVEYLRRKPAAECGLPIAERTFLPFFGKNACVYSDATT